MKYFVRYIVLITISCCFCASQSRADEYEDFGKIMTPGGELPDHYENMKNRVNKKVEEHTDKINHWLDKTKETWIDGPREESQVKKEAEASEMKRLENLQTKADKLERDQQFYTRMAKATNDRIAEINKNNSVCLGKATYSGRKSCLDALKNDPLVRDLPERKKLVDGKLASLGLEPVVWIPLFINELAPQDGCITAAENYDKAAELKNADNAVQQYEYLQKNCGDDLNKLVKQEGLKYPTRKNGAASNALFRDALSGNLRTTAPGAQNNNSSWNIGEIMEFGLKLGSVINQFQDIRRAAAPSVNTGASAYRSGVSSGGSGTRPEQGSSSTPCGSLGCWK